MRMTLVLLLAPVLLVPLARADSDDLSGGVLLVHAPPGVVYTTGTVAWCDSTHLADCEDQVTTIAANTEAVWFVLSAWAEEKSFSAVEFGLGDFDAESFYFLEDGICLDDAMAIHYPSVEDWPGPNTGIALAATGDAWSGQLVPIAWYAGYSYADADTIPLVGMQSTGHAGWVSGESRTTYDAECLGALGLGVSGKACCPEGGLDSDNPGVDEPAGACCHSQTCSILSEKGCDALGGSFFVDTDCHSDPCSLFDDAQVVCTVPGDYETLSLAVAEPNCSIIELADGTYTNLDGFRDIFMPDRDLTIRSASGDAEQCILEITDPEELLDPGVHVGFVFESATEATYLVQGITFSYGTGVPGGT